MTAIAAKPTTPAEAVTVEEARTTAVVAAEAKTTVVRRPPAALLPWPLRHEIVLGLGSALLYLHQDWEQCVLHRDIKPSNVMLDASFCRN